MTNLEWKALRLTSKAIALKLCFYILFPLLFVMMLINPDIGFRIANMFNGLAEELNEIAKKLQAEQEGVAQPVVRKDVI